MNNSYILPSYQGPLYDYGFGSWLGRNIGNIAQTIGGVALLASTPFTGPAGIAGASMLASGVGGIGGDAASTKNAAEQEAIIEKTNKKNSLIEQKMAMYNAQQPMVAKFGGSMEETGTFAPNSLVPLNSPYRSILAKGGHLPEGKATLKDAKEFMKLYPDEMAMGIEVEKEHTGNMKLRQRIAADHIIDHLKMTGGDPGYYSKLKQAGISDELNKMALGGMFDFKNGGIYVTPENKQAFTDFAKKNGMSSKQAIGLLKNMNEQGFIDPKEPQMRPMEYKKGGSLTPEKARKILHDGKVHGKPLTDKQRKYFGYISNKKDGGFIDNKFKQLADGGTPDNPKVTAAQQKLIADSQNDDFLKKRAEYKYLTQELDSALYGKDINKWMDFKSQTPLKNRTAVADSIVNAGGFTNSVMPSEVFTPEKYTKFKELKNVVENKFSLDPAKQAGANDPNAERWGLRSSLAAIDSAYNTRSVVNQGKPLVDMYATMKYKPDAGYDLKTNVSKVYGEGGSYDSIKPNGNLVTKYEGGGTHEQNPRGGIPIGQKARVEEGEVRVDFKDGSYIFSNRF